MRERKRGCWFVIGVFVASILFPGASIAAPPAPTVTLVGGSGDRTISLVPCTPPSSPAASFPDAVRLGQCYRGRDLIGALALTVRNGGKAAATIDMEFTREEDGHVFKVPDDREGIVLFDGQKQIQAPPGATSVIPLRFALAPREPLGALRGTITLAARTAAAVSEPPMSVSVNAAVAPLDTIVVQPPTIVIRDPGSDGAHGMVALAGPGVRQLAALQGASISQVQLSGGSTNVSAKLGKLLLDPLDPDRATSSISLTTTHLDPGKYIGDLPIWPLRANGPKVSVVVNAHHPWWLAFLLLLLGAVVGGVTFRLLALARRRALLNEVLDESLVAYRNARNDGTVAGYDLNGLIGRLNGDTRTLLIRPASTRLYPVRGAAAVRESIKGARTSADLDQDAVRVLDLVARVQRWLRIEPAARLLKDLEDDSPTDSAWRSTRTAQDTAVLLIAARREPVDAAATDVLVAHLLRQAEFHHGVLRIWRALSGRARTTALGGLFKPIVAPPATALVGVPPTVLERTAADQDAMDAQLKMALLAIPADPSPTGLRYPSTPKDGNEPVWDASPNFFAGWATLDAKSFGQVVRESRVTTRAYKLSVIGRELRHISAPDWLVVLAAVGIGALAYFPTLYTDTWGTTKDIVAALTAGLVGHVVVKWAALPAFQSLRLRATSPD